MRTFLRFAALALAGWGSAHAADPAPPRPNIVYIMSDDQGWQDVGFHGSAIRTPNIDELAKGGARLERFYAQPMCTPSRAALMTGRYPHRYGMQTLVIPSAGTYGIPTDEYLMPQALKEAGYETAIVGKWHLGHADRKYWPNQRGFDYQYGPLLGEIDYFTHSAHGVRDWFRNNEPVVEEGYVTELIGSDAVRVIEQHDTSKPLFLYLTFTAPHSPYQAPQAWLDRYKDEKDPSVKAYSAMISAMDDQIGRVLKALDRKKMRKNTLVVFQSDNGGPRSAQFTGEVDMSKSTIPANNGPYRDGKASLYEGGTRVAALANWPGRIPAGTVVNGPMHMVDMYPTFTALAGVTTHKGKPLDGLDMGQTLFGKAPSPRQEVIYDIEPFRAALSQGDWKLVWQATLPSKVELFNVASDPGEATNLADINPGKVAELQKRVQALSKEAVPPQLFADALGALKSTLFGSVLFPTDDAAVTELP
ncbi:MAG: arylsulfatase [Gammaproteobacteria bacterium]|jgi:arylsulfatase A-like enzyme|nr:arylsulfatase [Gammaproteobacteria bacterium]